MRRQDDTHGESSGEPEFCWQNLWIFNKCWSALLIIRLILCDPAAPRFGVRNLRIDDETTYSLRVSWQSVDFRNIRHYRLSYIGEGDRQEETVRWAKSI